MAAPSHIVMLGTAFETRGGIASVLRTYRDAGLFARWPVDFVATHRDGSALEKAAQALVGFVTFLGLLVRYPRAVLHVHSASRASFWRKCGFMALAMAARWPVVFHLHGGGFATFYDAECGPLRRAVVRFFLDRAACVVVVSQRWCAWMQQVTRNPRVVSIANPVTLPIPAVEPREPGLVVFTGRCVPEKGIDDLLAAVSSLVPRFPGLRIAIAGDGDVDAVRTRARALGIADRIDTIGWVEPRRRDALLARASVFVLPSHAEALPVSLLEAMAASCPVVATAVGGVPDVVDDGFNGLLVPPRAPEALAAAIARVLADPGLAREMGRAARATIAARFTPQRCLERLDALYTRLGMQARGLPAQPNTGDGPRMPVYRRPTPSLPEPQ